MYLRTYVVDVCLGKTLAYAIPIVNDLQSSEERISRSDGPCALVVTPTRELAIQVYQVFQMLTKVFVAHL